MSLPPTNEVGGNAPSRRPSKNASILATLVVAILILGSIVIYQQLQISNLSSRLSNQSSEFANPSSDVAILNFTVTKLNATGRPVMYLVFLNNGTSPASSLESLLVSVYASNNVFQSCYNNTQRGFFPLFSSEIVMIVSPLNCGEIGNKVALSATVDFLTTTGTKIKVYNAQTTVTQSEFSVPSTVVVDQLGIKTYVVAEIAKVTFYNWLLVVTNDSPTAIVSVNETAITNRGGVFTYEGCLLLRSGGPLGVGKNAHPLFPGESCQINNNIPVDLGPFKLGESLQVIVRVGYLNGSVSTVITTAMFIPPYAIFG